MAVWVFDWAAGRAVEFVGLMTAMLMVVVWAEELEPELAQEWGPDWVQEWELDWVEELGKEGGWQSAWRAAQKLVGLRVASTVGGWG